jgi:hypothetical protein
MAAAKTLQSDMLDPQIFTEAVRAAFRGKNALMGSVLVSSGAVMVSDNMPLGGQGAVGKKVQIPYFGRLGKFVNNPDGTAIEPRKIAQMMEEATVARSSLAFEISVWAQGLAQVNANLGDPYEEGARQIREEAVRRMDEVMVDTCKATPLVRNVYSSTSPVYADHRQLIRTRTKFGDEQDDIVAMTIHSQTEADLAELTDATGRPLLLETAADGQNNIRRFAGIPTLVSDRVPLDGSTMGTVTETGASVGNVSLSGTPLGPWDLKIDIVVGGAVGTATFRFSTDGGNTWSATLTTAATVELTDTATDSLVGNNGETGITAAFASATYNAASVYSSTANLCVSSLIFKRGAAAFWYAGSRLGAKTDVDILADTDIIAQHLYAAPHLYRRANYGSRPGVALLKHNVRNYIG